MSEESVFSPAWHRVSGLRPRLRSHVTFHRHVYRGERWYVLQDHASGRHHRFTWGAYALIAQMDGTRSLHEIWTSGQSQASESAPSQPETIRLLTQLHGADLLQSGVLPNTDELIKRGDRRKRSQFQSRTLNPLALRLPLADPNHFLDRTMAWLRPLFTLPALLLWVLTVCTGMALAAVHWTDITHHFRDHALSPHTLTALVLVYPLMKALHEFAHAYATKNWGGEVHEMGFSLLVFLPVPYVDASAAAAFPERRRRILVSAIGMMVEALLAALALFVWLAVEPGVVSTIAFSAMMIGSFSTLLFNGNPLLKFDGYYVLSDLIEIPNLSTRSNRYLTYLLQRHVFQMDSAEPPVKSEGERPWLFGYGVASFAYRLFITFVIALYVAGEFLILGVLIALWGVTLQLLLPIGRAMHAVATDGRFRGYRLQVGASLGLAGALAMALLLGLPLPLATQTEGVVWLPDEAQVRADTSGFVARLLAGDGESIEAGQALLTLENRELAGRARVAAARLDELQALHQAEGTRDRVRAKILTDELHAAEAELADINARLEALVVRSTRSGVLVLPSQQNLAGRYLKKGDLLAHVIAAMPARARVVVDQDQVGLVRARTRSVQVRLISHFDEVLTASVVHEVPGADHMLPSAALGIPGGGAIVVNPGAADGRETAQELFHFELALPGETSTPYVGQRVFVRFDHGWEPVGYRWARELRRLFLSRFAV